MQIPFRHRGRLFQKPRIDLLIREEGNEAYKSFMRQGLLYHSHITGQPIVDSFSIYHDTDPAGDSSDHSIAATTLEHTFGPPADNASLVSAFSNLRQTLNKSLNWDVGGEFAHVARPTSLSDNAQDIPHDQLVAAGFNMLNRRRRQSLLMALSVPLPNDCRSDNYMLVIRLSGATFEMTLVEGSCKVVTIIAYEANMDLRGDVLALKNLDAMTKGTRHTQLNNLHLAAAKSELSMVDTQTYLNSSNTSHAFASSLSKLKHERSQTIQQAIERFITTDLDKWDPNWHGNPPNTIGVLLSGDASQRDFAMLNQIITSSPTLLNLNVKLLDTHSVPPTQAAAHSVAAWGIDYPILPAPGKDWSERSDASDWYEQRSEDAAKFRCEVNDGGTPVFWCMQYDMVA